MRLSSDDIYDRIRKRIEAEEKERVRPEIERHERRIDSVTALKGILEAKLEKSGCDNTKSFSERHEIFTELFPQIRALEKVISDEWDERGALVSLAFRRTCERMENLPEVKELEEAYARACVIASRTEMVRDYQNGHVTEFGENGEVLYETV